MSWVSWSIDMVKNPFSRVFVFGTSIFLPVNVIFMSGNLKLESTMTAPLLYSLSRLTVARIGVNSMSRKYQLTAVAPSILAMSTSLFDALFPNQLFVI